VHVFFGEKTRTHFSFHLSRCSIRPRTEDTYLPKHRRDLQSYCTIQSSLLPALPPAGTGFLPSYSYLILMIIQILGSWFVALEFCKYDTESNMFSTWSCGHLFAAVVRYIVSDGAFPCATGTTPYLCRGKQIDFFARHGWTGISNCLHMVFDRLASASTTSLALRTSCLGLRVRMKI
jgi:hypothetical protein